MARFLNNNGNIPAHTECPFKSECRSSVYCVHLSSSRTKEYSCTLARSLDVLKSRSTQPRMLNTASTVQQTAQVWR